MARRGTFNCAVLEVTPIIEILLFVFLGAFAGSLVGAYRCANPDKPAPRLGNAIHLGVCVMVGAIIGALVFLALARFYYDPSN